MNEFVFVLLWETNLLQFYFLENTLAKYFSNASQLVYIISDFLGIFPFNTTKNEKEKKWVFDSHKRLTKIQQKCANILHQYIDDKHLASEIILHYVGICPQRKMINNAHQTTINHICLSTNDQFFITCGNDRQIKMWHTETASLIQNISWSYKTSKLYTNKTFFFVSSVRNFCQKMFNPQMGILTQSQINFLKKIKIEEPDSKMGRGGGVRHVFSERRS